MNSERPIRRFSISAGWSRLKFLLCARRFDPMVQGGHSHERHRRIALSAFAGFGAKGVSMATTLITVPLTLRYLGPERYGVWMTMSSVMMMMVFADLGLG